MRHCLGVCLTVMIKSNKMGMGKLNAIASRQRSSKTHHEVKRSHVTS